MDTIPGRDDNGIINTDLHDSSSDPQTSNSDADADDVSAVTDPGEQVDETSDDAANDVENSPGDDSQDPADPTQSDTDDDDTSTSPGPALIDSDGDGFSDEEERSAIPSSDPSNPLDTPLNPLDSDGDGCSDFDELNFPGSCDNNPNSTGSVEVEDPDDAFTFSLSIARHVDKPFTETQVDDILNTASVILQTVQTECEDIATNTTLARSGSLATFDIAAAVLTSESQLDAVFALPQDIKIVEAMIGVCGLPPDDDVSMLLGCAITTGSLVIIGDAEPDVWAHEWGHVLGLPHRDNCPRNLMHSFEIDTNAVNAVERRAFLTPTPSAHIVRPTRFAMSRATPPVVPQPDRLARRAAEPLADWLARLAGKRYLSGVPGSVMADMNPDATGHLTAMLSAPEYKGYRHNIVRMLGFTRDPAPCATLMARVSAETGELSFNQFAAIAESFLALGRLATHDSTNTALRWLLEGTDPATWAGRAVTWRYRSYSGDRLRHLLARLSIMALGVSKDLRALKHLRALVAADLPPDDALTEQMRQAIMRLEGKVPLARSAMDVRRFR